MRRGTTPTLTITVDADIEVYKLTLPTGKSLFA